MSDTHEAPEHYQFKALYLQTVMREWEHIRAAYTCYRYLGVVDPLDCVEQAELLVDLHVEFEQSLVDYVEQNPWVRRRMYPQEMVALAVAEAEEKAHEIARYIGMDYVGVAVTPKGPQGPPEG